MPKRKKKKPYSSRKIYHEVTIRYTQELREEMELLRAEITGLAGCVTALTDRIEDIDGSLWDSRQAQEVQSGRLMELAKLLKEARP